MSTETGARSPSAERAHARAAGDARRRQRAAALLVPLVIVAAAGVLRFYRLDEPPRIYFDETYYVEDARSMLAAGTETEFSVHPPLGKWLIAGSIAVFGDRPLGWRAPGALAGTLTVLATYLAGLRLFRRRGVAALAAILLAVDGLAFTMSRIAMLDVFLALFVVAGFWLLLVDRDRQWAHVPPDDAQGSLALPHLRHPHRWLAGLVFGVGVATKWSALLAIGAAGLFVLGSELAWRRRWTGSPWPRVWAPALSSLASLVLLPAVVYVLSYGGWFVNFTETRVGEERCPPGQPCDVGAVEVAYAWWGEQRAIARFHDQLEAPHPYRSHAAGWLWLRRPVAFHYESCPEPAVDCVVPVGTVSHVVGVGNPVIWWLGLLAYPALVWFAARDRDWRAWALLAFLAVQYVPWLIAQRPLFFFYMTPLVPFLCLGLAHVAARMHHHAWGRRLAWAAAAAAVAVFAFLYPVLAGVPIDPDAWRLRMLLDSWI